ncbi:MAG: hypothetical protein V3R84_03255 [Acidimicrobiia bacterium]
MFIDCNNCSQQHTEVCQDCVVTHVLRDLSGPLEVDPDQAEALDILADAGLVSPLRLIQRSDERDAAVG